MDKLLLTVLVLALSTSIVAGENNKTFPADFTFGVVTSAYQIEGGWDEDGKGETIWDRLLHSNVSYSNNNETGDVACDSYHKYDDDIELVASLGVQYYKFSISWSRIFPEGISNGVNLIGITYYQNIIEQLQNKSIVPLITLYHWDLPQYLQDIGGWTNPAIVPYFVHYARTAFQYFDTVRYWTTFDEPAQFCRGGYGLGTLAPLIAVDGVAEYLCSYVVLKAHAAVYNMHKTEFPNLKAYIAIVLDVPWSEPYSNKTEDQDAADRRNQFSVGLYANPLINGNWPDVVIERVEERSNKENFSRSRLPQFTEEEIASMKGTVDFIGIDFHDTRYVADDSEATYEDSSFENDMRVKLYADDSWPVDDIGNTIVPSSMRNVLNWLKTTYNNPQIFISDNSIATNDNFEDVRIQSLVDYLDNILDAMYEDEVWVIGYGLILMDQFEWKSGYSIHNGLFAVDFEDSDRPRTARQLVDYYREVSTNLIIPGTSTTTSIESTDNNVSRTKSITTSTEGITTSTEGSSSSDATEEPTEYSTTPGSSSRIHALSIFILTIIATFTRI